MKARASHVGSREASYGGASACHSRSHSPRPAMKKARNAAKQLKLATVPTQRPNVAGEVQWSAPHLGPCQGCPRVRWCRLPRSRHPRPLKLAFRRCSAAAHSMRGMQQFPSTKHSIQLGASTATQGTDMSILSDVMRQRLGGGPVQVLQPGYDERRRPLNPRSIIIHR